MHWYESAELRSVSFASRNWTWPKSDIVRGAEVSGWGRPISITDDGPWKLVEGSDLSEPPYCYMGRVTCSSSASRRRGTFWIGPNGVGITAAHVLDSWSKRSTVKLEFMDGRIFTANDVRRPAEYVPRSYYPEFDIAFLYLSSDQIEEIGGNLVLGRAQGASLLSFGPNGDDTGILEDDGEFQLSGSKSWIHHKASVLPEHSGGPLMSEDKNSVLGIHVAGMTNPFEGPYPNSCLGISLESIESILKRFI